MGISLDFSGVESNDFDPLPKGSHHATIFEVTSEESKQGKPYLNFQFKIVEEKNNNRRAFMNASLQPQSLWALKNLLVAAGYPKEELEGQLNLDLDDMCGRVVKIVIGHETYEGELRDRVKKVLPPSKGFVPFGDDDGAPSLDDEPQFETNGSTELSDDDLPFSMDDDE